mmetsp:Transcript_35161/g.34835  ORF Transcript_35161/g.34835 Transcript_35161/m.34835 type:complete len:83 (+) Transcript_35161:1219-1467(+)
MIISLRIDPKEPRRRTLDSDHRWMIKEFLNSKSSVQLSSKKREGNKRRCIPKIDFKVANILANPKLKPSGNITFSAKLKQFG